MCITSNTKGSDSSTQFIMDYEVVILSGMVSNLSCFV